MTKTKFWALLLAVCMLLSVFAACQNGQANEPAANDPTNAPATEEKTGEDAAKTETEAPAEAEKPAEEEIAEGGTFVYPIAADVQNLSAYAGQGTTEGETVFRALYNPLYKVGADGIRYYLAEKVEKSDDGKEVTITLRDDIKWHDGEPITADDLLFFPQYYKGYAKINGEEITFEKVDERTVRILLPTASATYWQKIGAAQMLPYHLYKDVPLEEIKTTELNELGIGSGPYKLKEWNKGESIVVERFDDYFAGKAHFDTIVFKILPDDNAREVAYKSGELSFKRIEDDLQLENYQKDENSTVYLYDENRVNYMAFNANSDLMSNIVARQAITYALNQEEIVYGAAGSNLAKIANSIYSPGNLYYNPDRPSYVQDVEKAKTLAAEANLFSRPLKLIYDSNYSSLANCAIIIQEQLAAIGIQVEVQGLDTAGYNQIFFYAQEGDWDMGLKNYPTSGDNSGPSFMFKKGNMLAANYCASDEALALWAAGEETLDESKRAEIYAQLDDVTDQDFAMYRLSYPQIGIVADKHLRGLMEITLSPLFEDWMRIYAVK